MKLDKLKYIVKVSECGSISKAAKELYLSQPTLTKAISSMEERYNVQIFNRTPTGIILTKDGEKFINSSKQIIYNLELLDDLFKVDDDYNRLELSVSSQQLDFMPELVVNTHKQYNSESVEFDFKFVDRGDVFSSVQNGETNLGFLVKTPYDSRGIDWTISSTNLQSEFLAKSDLFIYVGKNSPLYDKNIISPRESVNFPIICLDIDTLTRGELKLHKKFIYNSNSDIIFTNSIELCKYLLSNTDMVLYTHKWAKNFFKDTDIKIKKVSGFLTDQFELIYIKRNNEILSEIENNFLDNVKSSLNSNLD